MSHLREWQRRTSLAFRERKAGEARDQGVSVADYTLDVLAANYVGTTAAQVAQWRKGAA